MQCASNLRSIGQALNLYGLENKGSLPFGDYLQPGSGTWDINSNTANWSIKLASVLNRGKGGENFFNSSTSKGVFKCPSVHTTTGEAPDKFTLHYTAHPRLMPGTDKNSLNIIIDPPTGKQLVPYKLGKVKNSSEIVIIFDGTQYFGASGLWEGNAHPLGSGVDGWRMGVGGGWGHAMLNPSPASWDNNMDASVDGGDNKDCFGWNGNQQNIRWRHARNNVANFLFCDGHVGALVYKSQNKTELKRRNICVNWPS
jgi:prepilin-type processing-associated H-X9-DG protein